MMATSLEKELRLIRERLDSIENALAEEMSEDDKKARAEALEEHKRGRLLPSSGEASVACISVDQGKEETCGSKK
jgi:hypothetical protein